MLSGHIFCCCTCHRSGNALDLWSIHRELPICAAAREIQDRPIKTSYRKTAPDGPQIKQPRHRPPPLNWLNSYPLSTFSDRLGPEWVLRTRDKQGCATETGLFRFGRAVLKRMNELYG